MFALSFHSLTSPHSFNSLISLSHLTSPYLTSPYLTSPYLTSPHLTLPHLTSPHSHISLSPTLSLGFWFDDSWSDGRADTDDCHRVSYTHSYIVPSLTLTLSYTPALSLTLLHSLTPTIVTGSLSLCLRQSGERQRQRETEIEKDRDREIQRDRETERQRDRDRERQRQRKTETERDRDRERQRQRNADSYMSLVEWVRKWE